MIVDLRTLDDGAAIDADVCVVGGGPAAIALVEGLAGATIQVCLLESGGLEHEKRSQALAAGELTGIPYAPLDRTRFRMLGGSTHRWGARGAPMQEIDLRRREWTPHSGWPLTSEELRPHYERAQGLIGMHSPFDYDERVWQAFDRTPPQFDRDWLRYAAFQFGKVLLFGRHYRERLRRSANVSVYLHANAASLSTDTAGRRVESVEVRTVAGRRHRVRAGRFVLACGGVDNPRLLFLSNAVRPEGLCNEHGLVGRFFMEHPTCAVGEVVADDPRRLLSWFSPGKIAGRLVEVGLAVSPALQEARRCLNAVAMVVPETSRDSTLALRELLWDLQRRTMRKPLSSRLGCMLRDPLGLAANGVRHLLGRPKRYRSDGLLLEVRTEQHPHPDSRVTLSDTTDELGLRRAHLHWTMTELDKRTLRVAAEAVDRELRRLGLGELRRDAWVDDELAWSPRMRGGSHHMGTTRMAVDPREGVVDADCKAHAIENLYIVGSSVFPTGGFVNPTLTILALSLRLAEHLRRELAPRPRRESPPAAESLVAAQS